MRANQRAGWGGGGSDGCLHRPAGQGGGRRKDRVLKGPALSLAQALGTWKCVFWDEGWQGKELRQCEAHGQIWLHVQRKKKKKKKVEEDVFLALQSGPE